MSKPDGDAPRSAAALRYDASGDGAPEVIAHGRGEIAKAIVAAAEEAGVPVRTDPVLAEALQKLELGTEVPEPLWHGVAIALRWAWQLERRAREGG